MRLLLLLACIVCLAALFTVGLSVSPFYLYPPTNAFAQANPGLTNGIALASYIGTVVLGLIIAIMMIRRHHRIHHAYAD